MHWLFNEFQASVISTLRLPYWFSYWIIFDSLRRYLKLSTLFVIYVQSVRLRKIYIFFHNPVPCSQVSGPQGSQKFVDFDFILWIKLILAYSLPDRNSKWIQSSLVLSRPQLIPCTNKPVFYSVLRLNNVYYTKLYLIFITWSWVLFSSYVDSGHLPLTTKHIFWCITFHDPCISCAPTSPNFI